VFAVAVVFAVAFLVVILEQDLLLVMGLAQHWARHARTVLLPLGIPSSKEPRHSIKKRPPHFDRSCSRFCEQRVEKSASLPQPHATHETFCKPANTH
jgi:hypothetical protein